MNNRLKIMRMPEKESIERLSIAYPSNPFFTSKYVEARKINGDMPVLIEYFHNGECVNGFIAYESRGLLNRSIEVPSFPPVNGDDTFWDAFIRFLSKKNISHVTLGSFGSPDQTMVPDMAEIASRRERCEYHLDLRLSSQHIKLSSSHKRNIKRAQTAGVQVVASNSEEACADHLQLIESSMHRRTLRGERVKNSKIKGIWAFLQTGSGKIYQSVLDEKVLSSVLILEAEKGIYYHSAGSIAEGMTIGASHYLVYEIANEYRKQSKWLFNLGGTLKEQIGLERFKIGFGATPVKLTSFELYLGGLWRKLLTNTAEVLRGNSNRAIKRA